MRKIVVILMTLVLMLNLSIVAMGAENELQIPDVSVGADQTIYVAVVLNTSAVGDTIGVTYSYDKSVLEAIPEAATWGQKGVLQDFNQQDSGVWAASKAQDLKGTICVLAFRVKNGATLTRTTVSCTVTIKNDATKVGTYTAEGAVYAVCDHKYSSWESQGNLLHSKKCTVCGETQSQSHDWDDGSISDHPTNPALSLLTHTCKTCGETRSQETSKQNDMELPTMPPAPTEEPEEIEFVTIPPATEPPAERPTSPSQTGNQNNSNNQHNSNNQSNSNHQNSSGNQNNSNNQSNSNNQGNSNLTDYNQGANGNQSNSQNQQSGTQNDSTHNVENGTNSESGNHSHENQQENHTEPPIAIPIPEGVEIPEELLQHDHDHETEPTEEVHDHDHEHVAVDTEQAGISLMALLLAVALIAGAAVLITVLMKRTKRK